MGMPWECHDKALPMGCHAISQDDTLCDCLPGKGGAVSVTAHMARKPYHIQGVHER